MLQSFTGKNAIDFRRNLYRTDLLNVIEIIYSEEEVILADQRTDGGKKRVS
jgi:hypothetical protein